METTEASEFNQSADTQLRTSQEQKPLKHIKFMRRGTINSKKEERVAEQVAEFQLPQNAFENEEDMKDDPASKLVQNFNQYERIKKKLLLRMAVMSYVTKIQAKTELKVALAKATSDTKDVSKLSPMTKQKSEKISENIKTCIQRNSSQYDYDMEDLECKPFES